MYNISIRFKFFLFIIFNIIFACFYLYFKHDVGNDSSISEWLINYKGGFTRRGLGGEISLFIANYFSIELRKAILLIQIFLHITYLILIYIYLKDIKLNLFQLFALFSPIFLMYPISEIEALGRKEILIFLFFIITMIFANQKYSPKFINLSIFIFFPILCLIWEPVILFAPYFAVILIKKNNLKNLNEVFIKLLIIFSPSLFVIIIIFLNPLDQIGHSEMCDFLEKNFSERCYMSAELLIKNTIYFDTLFIYERVEFTHLLRYFLIFFIGFLPLHLIIFGNAFLSKKNFIEFYISFKNLYLFLYAPVVLLFAFGHDWGRWVNILYTLSILLYFYFLKNNFITNYLDKTNFIYKILSKRRIILVLIFYIFAFFWNPKTLITGDVATNSLYKIMYKASKIVFEFDSLRLFENNPIIRFHKNYIE